MSMPRIVFSLLSVVLVVACATSPLGRRQLKLVSDSEVSQMGINSFTELKQKTPATKDSREAAYVQCVAGAITRVIPQMQWDVTIPASWEVVTFESKDVNAFALPGGKIGVYTGLLGVATTQDQLAAVIGHEVSHVLAGHSAERVSSDAVGEVGTVVASAFTGIDASTLSVATKTLFLLPYSRAHESEADLLGMDLMSKAGFDPSQSIALWKNMAAASNGQAQPQMLSTHPSNSTRIHDLSARLPQDQVLYQQARASGMRPSCSR
ncbi:MAG: Peptidase family [Hydrocarboniphaga sp.]|uniref:M48 family metallopeptidase n=1 Tax=Hydrocarboniphaga sp. TaxID=2033016 RepID=UPI002627E2AC|nr:M48 family metallopeptidase [Hydrocarboniphaga sp.]MDB5972847.1 Peptidase family [Hydrocarboniphaga sp.]